LIGQWLNSEEEHNLVRSYDEKRLKYFDREDLKELVEIVARWRLLLGVTGDSSDTELLVITQFLYDNYPNLTLTDLRYAMNWTISGKVDVGFVSQKNISSYYVSRAINAYIAEKRQIMNLIEERKNAFMAQAESTPLEHTPTEKANVFKSIVLSLFDSYRKEKPIIDYNDIVYNWLKKSKNLCILPEIISEAVRYGRQRVSEEKQDNAFMNRINQSLEQDIELRQKKYARTFMIMHFFKQINGEQDIVALIKPSDFI
jgi:hypothetical protein